MYCCFAFWIFCFTFLVCYSLCFLKLRRYSALNFVRIIKLWFLEEYIAHPSCTEPSSAYICHCAFISFQSLLPSFCTVSLIVCLPSAACLGSPVLGYLAAGILIGPYGLSIIRHVHGTKAIAEFGVVFLLFNIGLEVDSIKSLFLFLFVNLRQ